MTPVTTDRVPVVFRAHTAEEAQAIAKRWARDEGLRIRTIASVRRRPDMATWDVGPAWEVTLVVVK